MKVLFHLNATLFLMVWFIFLAPRAYGSEQIFSLEIAALKEPVRAGAELRLSVTVKNTSNRPISFITSPGPIPDDSFYYEIHVLDTRGKSAPPSAEMRLRDPHLPTYFGSRFSRELRPGESFVEEINVTRYYELNRPGKYMIVVSREFPPSQNLGQGKVKSNSISVTVVR